MENRQDSITAKKVLSVLDQEKKKAVKDLKTALLGRMNRVHSSDIKVEYFECLEDVSQVKSGVMIFLNNDDSSDSLTDEDKEKGQKIVDDITALLDTQLNPPEPKIDNAQSRYTFKDGSQARYEDYSIVENTYRDTVLFDRMTRLMNLSSDGFAFLGIQDKNLWEQEDEIGEVDLFEQQEG